MLEPYQVRGMETYSTVLFHLQKEVSLSTLAQDIIDIDKSSAQVSTIISQNYRAFDLGVFFILLLDSSKQFYQFYT